MKRNLIAKICLSLALTFTSAAMVPAPVSAAVPQTVAASEIGLATSGARVVFISEKKTARGISYTEVLGEILPASDKGTPIHFQVNLPEKWNGKMVQFGGGGFNGVLVTADGHAPGEAEAEPTPLEQGYATYGSDSGHVGELWDASFAQNEEALRNFAHEQLKKTHDTALRIITEFYGKSPRKSYFIGGSNGGREALQAAQRYGTDYDGIISLYPVLNWIPKGIADNRNANALLADGGKGWMSAEDFKKVHDTWLSMTDELDGLADGLVQNYAAAEKMTPEILKALEKDLTPEQMEILTLFLSPMHFEYPLANDFRTMPGFSLGQELRDDILNQFGSRAGVRDGEMALSSNGSLGWQSFRRGDVDMEHFDYRKHKDVLQASSALLDATNPDLSAFRAHGGKLLILHGTTDQLVTVKGSIQYYEKLKDVFGEEELDKFVKFYLVPGFGHSMGGVFMMGRNLLADLDQWADGGKEPDVLTVVDQNEKTFGRKQFLAPWPYYSRYRGGDPQDADSFVKAK